MVPTKVARFSAVIRVIGVILLIPSALGLAFTALLLLATMMSTADVMSTAHNEAQQTGAAIGSVLAFGFTLFIGVLSLVGGLLGWLLLLNRKVYKCVRCGFIIERA
jgi:hypothetical protein